MTLPSAGGRGFAGDIVVSEPLAARGGQIFDGDLGRSSIQHDIPGGDGSFSGFVGAGRSVGSVAIGGSIYGGRRDFCGDVYAALDTDARINAVEGQASPSPFF
jgi:hypothetical protein